MSVLLGLALKYNDTYYCHFIVVPLGLYALLIWLNLSIQAVMLLFGLFVALSMILVMMRHRYNQRQFDSVALIGEARS